MAGKLNKSQVYSILWQWKAEVDEGTQTVQLSEQQATNAERAISKLRRELAEEYDDIGKADVVVFEVSRGASDIDVLRENDAEE
ncbi:hypothetical protein BH789_gp073 [Gordonia phage GMA6]|uniref:Uncharacterized protein n=1 Tax=Gordonia phage GMA6 TaxID=1647285 RepID=A0A0K0NL75_9CAUD|nr:hypothetical protein BH789_gp073 [Gordonia phage GMA6]AKL88354.1 hypothetical protein GMA6_73 [Gordonia phage GMA6]